MRVITNYRLPAVTFPLARNCRVDNTLSMATETTAAALDEALTRYHELAARLNADQNSHEDRALVAEFDAAYAEVERLQDAMWS